MTSQQRPLLIPSPRTPGQEELPYTPVPGDSLIPISSYPKPTSAMDSNSQIEINENSYQVPGFLRNSSSHRSISSIQSKTSSGHSVREVNFSEMRTRTVRHGSRGADSTGLAPPIERLMMKMLG
ncbi:UNVERIFIED_CONTAM: hypothetical protein Slati_0864200 [Sesamum latifolium]|uniref:Uncharacterized protein n=1 Tax=Sesamum latifolium TaxID=2727402 RepID=A0AAW2XTX4_9LAMI